MWDEPSGERPARPWIGARLTRAVVIGALRLYQMTLSRVLPSSCRFNPSCSQYMLEAVRVHGAFRGLGLGLWRVCRCNPFSRGGEDPVPGRRLRRTEPRE
jgi:hypothetical protein